jgi:hypothetical protein
MRAPSVEIIAIMIPIISIVMGIGFGMLALTLSYRRKREIFQLYHAQRMAAIEKGVELPPLPPEIFEGFKPSFTAQSHLRHLWRGLMLVFLGIILFVAIYFSDGIEDAWWGLIPAAFGLADLLYYFLAARKLALQDSMTPGAPTGSPGSDTH